jgi:hypothetical protein
LGSVRTERADSAGESALSIQWSIARPAQGKSILHLANAEGRSHNAGWGRTGARQRRTRA